MTSFGLNETVEREFELGDVAFFRSTKITVSLHFPDDHSWWHFSKLDPSEKTPEYVAKFRLRDLDTVTGRLAYRIATSGGDELFRSDRRLGDYVWSGTRGDGQSNAAVYDRENAGTAIQSRMQLKLYLSYRGDATLTNRADLVVVCQPK